MQEIKLYSRDENKNILMWECYIINKGVTCSLFMSSGLLDGARTINYEHNIVGKQGRDNYEQAESRLKSRANLKKRRGYIELTVEQYREVEVSQDKNWTLDDIVPMTRLDADGNAKVMKASQYYRSKPNWTDPYGKFWKNRKYFYLQNPYEPKEKGAVIPDFNNKEYSGQCKINGVRAFIRVRKGKVIITSKDGLVYNAVNHINEWCENNQDLFGEDNTIILDGELYIYGESLQVIQSAVKSVDLNTPRVIFILFDIAVEDFTNAERWQHIKNEIRIDLNAPMERVITYKVRSDIEAQRLCDKFIGLGHEGIIIRDKAAPYGFGSRKVNMTKLKRTISKEFTIVRVIPQPKQNHLGMFVCTHKGKEFKVNPTFTDNEKIQLRKHSAIYIGKKLQTSFYEWTDDEKPLHIIETVIRNYE